MSTIRQASPRWSSSRFSGPATKSCKRTMGRRAGESARGSRQSGRNGPEHTVKNGLGLFVSCASCRTTKRADHLSYDGVRCGAEAGSQGGGRDGLDHQAVPAGATDRSAGGRGPANLEQPSTRTAARRPIRVTAAMQVTPKARLAKGFDSVASYCRRHLFERGIGMPKPIHLIDIVTANKENYYK